jgi:precorrin-2 dehydrogenase/sirohydrochlorin ferrochelatase
MPPPSPFSLELVLEGRAALVVGPVPELRARVVRLLDAGAQVTVLEARGEPDASIAGRVAWLPRRAEDADLEGKAIVFVAPWSTADEEARARRWHADAVRRGALFCTLDRPEASTFTNVAVVRTQALTMTFGSRGKSPGLVRRIREDLEALFSDPRFERFVEELGTLRASIPRAERATRMAEAVRGFVIEARLRYPDWFERGGSPKDV